MIPCPTPPNPLLAAPSLARAGAGGGPAVRVGGGPGGPAQEPGGSPGREGAGGVHVSPSDLLRHSKAVRVQNTQRRRWAYIPSTALSQPGFRKRQPQSKHQVLALERRPTNKTRNQSGSPGASEPSTGLGGTHHRLCPSSSGSTACAVLASRAHEGDPSPSFLFPPD